jgi:small subunit ribosomal protein S4
MTEYGERLREKQKLKRFYGVFEAQFRRYFALAGRSTENTGEALLSILERRLDNVVHRLGFASSRPAGRQLVAHGHVLLNGKNCNIPSLLVSTGDVITVKSRPRSTLTVKLNQQVHTEPIPDFLEITGSEPPEGRMIRIPSRGDVDPRLTKDKELQEQLIIEFCSR